MFSVSKKLVKKRGYTVKNGKVLQNLKTYNTKDLSKSFRKLSQGLFVGCTTVLLMFSVSKKLVKMKYTVKMAKF